jgi:hypothetical protein
VTEACLVVLVPLTADLVDSTLADFGVVGVADAFFGILSKAGFLMLLGSFDTVCFVGGIRHVDFLSSA